LNLKLGQLAFQGFTLFYFAQQLRAGVCIRVAYDVHFFISLNLCNGPLHNWLAMPDIALWLAFVVVFSEHKIKWCDTVAPFDLELLSNTQQLLRFNWGEFAIVKTQGVGVFP
jgi:hypothetical protein